MGRTACTEPQCLYKVDLYLYLYLYFSACTRVHFYLYLYLYFRACTRVHFSFTFTFTSVPVQGCILPLPLLQCLYKGALLLLRGIKPW
jgi:hypothetical protein